MQTNNLTILDGLCSLHGNSLRPRSSTLEALNGNGYTAAYTLMVINDDARCLVD